MARATSATVTLNHNGPDSAITVKVEYDSVCGSSGLTEFPYTPHQLKNL